MTPTLPLCVSLSPRRCPLRLCAPLTALGQFCAVLWFFAHGPFCPRLECQLLDGWALFGIFCVAAALAHTQGHAVDSRMSPEKGLPAARQLPFLALVLTRKPQNQEGEQWSQRRNVCEAGKISREWGPQGPSALHHSGSAGNVNSSCHLRVTHSGRQAGTSTSPRLFPSQKRTLKMGAFYVHFTGKVKAQFPVACTWSQQRLEGGGGKKGQGRGGRGGASTQVCLAQPPHPLQGH